MDALTGTSDNTFLTLEECQCLTSISLNNFESATLIDPQSCGLGPYQTVADDVAQCVGLLGQNNRGIQVTNTTSGHEWIKTTLMIFLHDSLSIHLLLL